MEFRVPGRNPWPRAWLIFEARRLRLFGDLVANMFWQGRFTGFEVWFSASGQGKPPLRRLPTSHNPPRKFTKNHPRRKKKMEVCSCVFANRLLFFRLHINLLHL